MLARILILQCSLVISLNAQELSNTKPIAGWFQEFIYDSAIDSLGNKYISFYTSGSQNNDPVNIIDVPQNLETGSYVVKVTSYETIEWIKHFNGKINAIEIGGNNSILLSGTYNDYGFQLLKINGDGEILWRIKEGFTCYISDIIIDNDGNSYITGTASAWRIFGYEINRDSCCGDHDFLVKFDSYGNIIWLRASTPNSFTSGKFLSFDKFGNIILVGNFRYSMAMEGYSLANNIGIDNAYIASYTPDGTINWLKGYGGSESQFIINDLEIDNVGNMYIGGGFTETANLDGIPAFTSTGEYDFFIAKLDTQGSIIWLEKGGTTKREIVSDILITDDGLLLSGVASGDISIGSKSLSNIRVPRSFICRINSLGEAIWIKDFADTPDDPSIIDIGFQPHFKLHYINEKTFNVIGGFSGTLESPLRNLSARYWESFTAILSDDCYQINSAGIDTTIDLCVDSAFKLSIEPGNNNGYWKHISGEIPTFKKVTNNEFLIANIAVGETIFQWNLEHCNSISSREIVINRLHTKKPEIISEYPICLSTLGQVEVTASGNSVKWYDDLNLSSLVGDGLTFYPTLLKPYYVTQNIDGCESYPAIINITERPLSKKLESEYISGCQNSVIEITIKGQNVFWYSDFESEVSFYEGNTYTTISQIPVQKQYFITQTIPGFCESLKSPMTIQVRETPPLPQINNIFESCIGSEITLSASGIALSWYKAKEELIPDLVGETYVTSFLNPGKSTIYVTQRIHNCESEKAPIEIDVYSFVEDQLFISNVITPNNDGKNDSFYLLPSSSEVCLGIFKRIVISNRWGKEVHKSTDRNFVWESEKSAGTYYYSIEFSNQKLQGWLTVLM